MAMTKMEKDTMVKNLAFQMVEADLRDAGEIGAYTYALPVGEVDGETRYAKITITALNNKATKTTAAFDYDERVAAWTEEKTRKAREAEEKAAAKAAKQAEKASKAEK